MADGGLFFFFIALWCLLGSWFSVILKELKRIKKAIRKEDDYPPYD